MEKDIYPQKNTVLSGIKGISTRSYVDSGEDFKDVVAESYDEASIPKGYRSVSLNFNLRKEENFLISFGRVVSQDLTLRIYNSYSVKDKILTQEVGFTTSQNKVIDKPDEVKKLLSQYHITNKDIEQYNKEILNDFFLRDWCKVYDSKYTPNDWGEVKVENWE